MRIPNADQNVLVSRRLYVSEESGDVYEGDIPNHQGDVIRYARPVELRLDENGAPHFGEVHFEEFRAREVYFQKHLFGMDEKTSALVYARAVTDWLNEIVEREREDDRRRQENNARLALDVEANRNVYRDRDAMIAELQRNYMNGFIRAGGYGMAGPLPADFALNHEWGMPVYHPARAVIRPADVDDVEPEMRAGRGNPPEDAA